MNCPRIRRWLLIPLGLLVAPFIFWLLIVLAGPTSWAKVRFTNAIHRATGRSVQLDRLSVGLFGGISLGHLEIGAPGSLDDPWLRAEEITLDLGPLSVFRGHMKPGQVTVHNATLRVLRREDGTLELTDLVRSSSNETEGETEESNCCALGTCLAGAHQTRIAFDGGILQVVDHLRETKYEIHNVEGEATIEGKKGGYFAFNGLLNGGTVQITGQFDRTMREPSFDVEVVARDVDVNKESAILRYLIPVMVGEHTRLEGKMKAQVSLQGRGADTSTIAKYLRGTGTVAIDPIRLEGSSFVESICKLAELPKVTLTESIRSQFSIENERITTLASTIQLGSTPLRFTGWTDFDGNLDYKVDLESMTHRIPENALRFLRELDVDVEKMTTLQLSGSLNHLVFRVDGEQIDPEPENSPPRRTSERERLRVLGRKIMDRVIR